MGAKAGYNVKQLFRRVAAALPGMDAPVEPQQQAPIVNVDLKETTPTETPGSVPVNKQFKNKKIEFYFSLIHTYTLLIILALNLYRPNRDTHTHETNFKSVQFVNFISSFSGNEFI